MPIDPLPLAIRHEQYEFIVGFHRQVTGVSSINSRIAVLDGLRGLAILAVIVCHVNWAFGGPIVAGDFDGPVAALLGCTWIGVDLFFVLSGFLITGILFDAKDSIGYFRNFYVRRALRIMPLYYAFLIFAIVVLPKLAAGWEKLVDLSAGDKASLFLYYTNFQLAFVRPGLGYFHAFWSLAVEEHFYLLWPIVVWALGRNSLMKLCIGLASASFILRLILVLRGSGSLIAFFITPCRLDGLLAGAYLALAWRDLHDWNRMRKIAPTLALGTGCMLAGMALGQRHFLPHGLNSGAVVTFGLAALALFFMSLIALALDSASTSQLRRLLENRVLGKIGFYSYAIYVFHSLILAAVVPTMIPQLPLVLLKLLGVAVILVTSMVAAWLSYHLFEKYFLRLRPILAYSNPSRSHRWSRAQEPTLSNA